MGNNPLEEWAYHHSPCCTGLLKGPESFLGDSDAGLRRIGTSAPDYRKAHVTQCKLMTDQIVNVCPCSPIQKSLTVKAGGSVNLLYVIQLVFKVADDIPLDPFKKKKKEGGGGLQCAQMQSCVHEYPESKARIVTSALSQPMICSGNILSHEASPVFGT